jgi:cytochrome c oxidase subunit I
LLAGDYLLTARLLHDGGVRAVYHDARMRFSSDHKAIGLQYLWLALFSVFVGMALSLLLRFGFAGTEARLPWLAEWTAAPQRNGTLAVLHGSLMVFFVLTAAPQAGFGSYFLPLQIGAREMAFPALNRLTFWATVISFAIIASSFFIPARETGLSVWIAGVALFCLASLASAINFSVTVIDLRGEGMSLPRLPLTVWAWFINAVLGMLIFSILLASVTLLLSDRVASTHFFRGFALLPASTAAPLSLAASQALWQRLFWFFAQAQVYVAMLPCFGIVTHLLATLARRPVWKERWVVLALCAVGLFGFCIWGEHMFSSGLDPYSPLVFAVLASSLGLPAVVLVMSWFATLWKARLATTTAALFSLGFVALFLTGGVSGVLLARSAIARAAGNSDFVTGHFHLVMGIAATFALLAALFFWFPKMFGRRLNESLGKMHFWLTFAGVCCVFLPMHWLGLVQTAPSGDLESHAGASGLPAFILVAIVVTIAVQLIFLGNFVWSLVRGETVAECNPWRATTLEWSVPSPPPADDFGASLPAVYRGAYEFGGAVPVPGTGRRAHEDFRPQHLAPDEAAAS